MSESPISVIDYLLAKGITESKGQGRLLLAQGAVKLNMCNAVPDDRIYPGGIHTVHIGNTRYNMRELDAMSASQFGRMNTKEN